MQTDSQRHRKQPAIFCRDTACRVRRFASGHIPLETFHRNVSKVAVLQAGHRAERSCSLRPRKAIAFLTHLRPVPGSMGTGISPSADGDLEGTCPLRTPRQLCSVGSAFSGTRMRCVLSLHDDFCACSCDFAARPFRPRKAAAFCPFLRVPGSMGTGISPSADGDLEGTCPLRTPRQLCSVGSAFSGTRMRCVFVPARWVLCSVTVCSYSGYF